MSSKKHAFFDEDRVELWKMLPLDTPMSVGIDPSTVCNFKCKYCAQSVPERFDEMKFKPEIMKMDIFEKIVEQLQEFPRKIKKIHLECKGEPLCNPHIADMVRLLKEADVAECVQIITNASLLDRKMSDQLIDAGLDILCVSMQGMTAEKYRDICGTDINMNEFIDNIRYFYEHRRISKLYVKNVDIALENSLEEEMFYQTFREISDRVFVEKIANLFSSVDYSDIIRKNDNINKYGEEICWSHICGFPFYYLLVFPNGDVRPCSNITPSAIFGNVTRETLREIWNGKKRLGFLKMQLLEKRYLNPACKQCHRPYENLRPEDRLDEHKTVLMKKFGV